MLNDPLKKCQKCKQLLEMSMFYIHKKTGKPYSYCKECNNAISRNRDKEKTKKYNKLKYMNNKETYNKNSSKNYYENRQKYIDHAVRRESIRKLEDSSYAFTRRLRDRIRKAFKRLSVNGKVMSCKEYGINFAEIISYIGDRPSADFELDHIIPLVAFDLDIPLHVKLANSKYNLRWLSVSDNRKKHTNIPSEAYVDENLRSILTAIGLL